MPVDPITSINPISNLTGLADTAKVIKLESAQSDFIQILGNAINSLSQKENVANQATTSLAAGEDIELHQVMLAMQEADLNFRLALQVRNKLVEAYQEVMRMQI
ncbi:MAG: flagellar hook-basal body complex protein FliE [Chloroflexota bacterium]